MKVYNVYALKDTVAEEWGNPILAKNHGMIKRIMIDQLSKINNPEDYELYQIGFFDNETGEIWSHEHEKIHLAEIKDIEQNSVNFESYDKMRRDQLALARRGYNGQGSSIQNQPETKTEKE